MIIAIFLLFLASSFFSGSETALTATNKIKLQSKAANGDKRSANLLKFVENSEEFISGILIANNVPNIILPSLVTIVALEYGINVGIATAVLTVMIIIFAEVLPKSIAAAYPERISHIVYPFTYILLKVLKPFTYLLNMFTRFVIRVLGRGNEDEATFSKDEMRAMVDIGHTEGTFAPDEMQRLKGMLDFTKLNVSDILKTPRIDIQAIPVEYTFEQAKEILSNNQYTRYPIYEGDIDHIVGVFHSKFALQWITEPDRTVREVSDLSPLYVHEFQAVNSVFKKMLQEKKHFAVVHDEYGGTEGIVTHEDLIEAMIGQDIEDETDTYGSFIVKQTDHEIICEGKLTLHRLNNVFSTNIPEDEDNLAGFLLAQYGGLPEIGEVIKFNNLTFEILEADEKKISQVRITKHDEEEESE
ncbi:hemolysin and related protein containing CBS domains [Geomicrobium sp. JCM 19037]|uniref:hemolysin family protein n=1 Tax=Geomicrobium sp. JCM 19037 TaxID=1460634 RepID=UPI00045F40CB|nr:CNNM domain-containing protein [Geomicrobium sp. JCM 19037]GAK04472.1 hemolysin and related protein containing CBS domains [Geomicrobium sp. JCM 19037]